MRVKDKESVFTFRIICVELLLEALVFRQ